MEKKIQYLKLAAAVHDHATVDYTSDYADISPANRGELQFYKAFASLDRAEGLCRLSCIWKTGDKKKNIQAHNYLLHFNHLGIRDYWVEDITRYGVIGWMNRINYEIIPISLLEAASLIQDAYTQNKLYHTKAADGIADNHFMFNYGPTEAELMGSQINIHLLPNNLDLKMFINIYLSALRRSDKSLLYDLSAPVRQKQLGDRLCYLQENHTELDYCTFICSKIINTYCEGSVGQAEVSIIVGTPQDNIERIFYQLSILKEENHYYLLDIRELKRENIHLLHPDNPLKYNVCAMLYNHDAQEEIQRWLNQQASIFLAGEISCGEQYKWLAGGSAPWEEYNFAHAISAEFFLSDNEFLVYCQRPERTAGINRILTEDLPGCLELKGQYYLDNKELLQRLCSVDEQEGKSNLTKLLSNKKVSSYLVILQVEEIDQFTAWINQVADKSVKLANRLYYYLFNKNDTFFEVYSAGNYNWLIIYRDPKGDLLQSLKSSYKCQDIIQDHEFEDYFDLFTPPLTEKRKWAIFQQLLRLDKEAGYMQKMGLIPSVKEVATQYGVII